MSGKTEKPTPKVNHPGSFPATPTLNTSGISDLPTKKERTGSTAPSPLITSFTAPLASSLDDDSDHPKSGSSDGGYRPRLYDRQRVPPRSVPTDWELPSRNPPSSTTGLFTQQPQKAPQAKPYIDDDQPFALITSSYDPSSNPTPAGHKLAYRQLLTALGSDNEDLTTQLRAQVYAHNLAVTEGKDEISIIDALCYRLDEIRHWAQHCKTTIVSLHYIVQKERAAHHATKTALRTAQDQLEAARIQVPTGIDSSDDEPTVPAPPHRGAAPGLSTGLPDFRYDTAFPYITRGVPAFSRSIEISKSLKIPLEANKIPPYNGNKDPETIHKFLRALDHHIQLLKDEFSDYQLIRYASTNLQGSVLEWAQQYRSQHPTAPWKAFLQAFKTRWVSPTAHFHLASKLNAMQVKGASSIDTFNYEFSQTLDMLGYKPKDVPEAHPYYALYQSKIKDPAIQQTIQTQAFTMGLQNEPMTLDTLMELASRLLAAKASTTANPPRPPAGNPSKSTGSHRRPFKAAVRALDSGSSADEDENRAEAPPATGDQEAYAIQHRTSTYIRRCHLCMALSHMMKECPLQAGLQQLRRDAAQKAEPRGARKDSKKPGKD
ncbi:hypothetical protein BJ508DRAFT_335335 [Ascobolus immersus RN42]|uniref:Ty3 transposon capsid-like protein domain-containing protein n=1 Tax=Ascobolus immersus RN42 TaxID=1160509 RepID=A0A3N4HCW6_ASCIM|nr:hypothetical protein BJ508DRAFT_335335 [Ascobolus immersus RN42]